MNINRSLLKFLNKANPLSENFNTFTSSTNESIENNRLFNFAMRQASSMDEATDTEMKQISLVEDQLLVLLSRILIQNNWLIQMKR
uniref:Uncharacterized protein n=1 Tax=Trichobilharzia regenti TaxID=157069 RepID=A0AA85K546_TRIRE|nr:unnamed protein product [Trichobilharzia regenti]